MTMFQDRVVRGQRKNKGVRKEDVEYQRRNRCYIVH